MWKPARIKQKNVTLASPKILRLGKKERISLFCTQLFVSLATPNLLTFGKTPINLDHWSYFATSQQMKCKHFFVLMLQNLVFRSLNRNFAP